MIINWIFILIILLILLFFFLYDLFYKFENFILREYRLIIVKNKNYILLHFKNIINGENIIYKIYKNKFIL
jgi:hypothetical protein